MTRKEYTVLIFTLFLVFLTFTPAMAGQDTPANWKTICEGLSTVTFPAEDSPGPKDIKDLKDCSAYDLYYGISQPVNPVKARLCAYSQMTNPRDEGPFDKTAILMTIYANGIGAKRNFDLAIKLACSTDGAPMEIEGRVLRLAKLKAKNWKGTDFSLCDDVSSGYLAGYCADHRERFASKYREHKINKIQVKWSARDKKELAALAKVAYSYFDIHADNEIDQGGTARTAMYIDDKAGAQENFLKILELLEQGKFPRYPSAQFLAVDSQLNSLYQNIQKNPEPEWGTVTKENIKITQRAWIKYRDAWVKFCAKKYPDVSADCVRSYLTLQRIKELEEFN
ncbi:MAG: lysozyme inhibitor LprI family protein [Syntrophorhabdus sp.]